MGTRYADAQMVRPESRPVRRTLPLVVVAAALVAAFSGCGTGTRAELRTDLVSTGSEAVDAVLSRLGELPTAVYAADYDVSLPSIADGQGATIRPESDVEVSTTQAEPNRRSLTIGDVRFIVEPGQSGGRTCDLSTGECTPEILAQRVSDVQMTNDFFGTSLVARVRRDASVAIAAPAASTEDVDGETATCVAIPMSPPASAPDESPVTTYCVLDNGVLTRLDAADIDVTITDYSTEADERQFQIGP